MEKKYDQVEYNGMIGSKPISNRMTWADQMVSSEVRKFLYFIYELNKKEGKTKAAGRVRRVQQ